MMSIDRRSVIRGILGVPVLGGVAAALGHASPRHGGGHDERISAERAALLHAAAVLRLINTGQHKHRFAVGTFTTLDELSVSPALREWLSDPKSEQVNLGATLYSSINLRSPQITHGWNSRFRLSKDAHRYAITLFDQNDRSRALSTDEGGLVWEGRPRTGPQNDEWTTAPRLLEGARPVGNSPRPAPPKLVSWASALAALLVVPLQADHCSEGGCCCGGECCHDAGCGCLGPCADVSGPHCHNCGCECCIWCC